MEMDRDLQRRVLWILHRGLVEARNLANGNQHQQLFDLADALEQFPGFLDRWEDGHLERIRFNLKTYRRQHPQSSYDYLRCLDVDPVPPRF